MKKQKVITKDCKSSNVKKADKAIKKQIKKTENKENAQDREYKQFILDKIDEFNKNDKPTIVYFCDTFYPLIDGVIKVLDNYATRLTDDFNVVVVVPKHKNIVVKKDYLVIGVASMYFKFINYDLAFPDVDSFLAKAMKKLNVDIVHSHSPFNMGIYAARLAKRKKVPFVMTMHSQYKLDFMKHTNSELLTSFMVDQIVKVFNKSTEVWTMHNKIRDQLIDYGYTGKFYMVPNATEFATPPNISDIRALVKNKFNIKDKEFVMLFVGRIVELKNIFFTLEALKILKAQGMKFKMLFIGDGPDIDDLRARVKEYKLEKEVIIAGKITDRDMLMGIYDRANLFLFPSIYDASSIVQIEAAAYKTPVLFIENTVTSATVENNVNGFTAPNDVNEYAKRICEIYNDKKLLEEVSENAHRDLYVTWQEVKDIIEKRYKYLISKNKRKHSLLDAVKNAKK